MASRPKPKALEHLTTTTNTRNTVQGAQQEQQAIAEGMSICNSLYKAATILCAGVSQQENVLKNFAAAEKVAAAFNMMSGAKFLSGNELQSAVRAGNEGMSPLRHGRQSSVAGEDFNAFCNAVCHVGR